MFSPRISEARDTDLIVGACVSGWFSFPGSARVFFHDWKISRKKRRRIGSPSESRAICGQEIAVFQATTGPLPSSSSSPREESCFAFHPVYLFFRWCPTFVSGDLFGFSFFAISSSGLSRLHARLLAHDILTLADVANSISQSVASETPHFRCS